MYIVLLTTRGAASWPRFTPVEKVHATLRLVIEGVLISSRQLYRVEAKFLAGMSHCPSSVLLSPVDAAERLNAPTERTTAPIKSLPLSPFTLFRSRIIRQLWMSLCNTQTVTS